MKILIGSDHLTTSDISRQIIDELISDDYTKDHRYIIIPLDASVYSIAADKEALYDLVFIATVMLTGITIE